MNRLSNESSPYLQQHAGNPVDWHPWDKIAFEKAQKENKPIFLSIGYSTCHWCHVMAHESFEDPQVAEALNRDFISVKVDREERPDIDDVYMSAVIALSGSGGWPMSVWLTPEGKPFFAGTYFPKNRFLPLLDRIRSVWANQKNDLEQDGETLLHAVQNAALLEKTEGLAASMLTGNLLDKFLTIHQRSFDEAHGGFGGAPKFPQTMNLMVLLRKDLASGLGQSESMIRQTLTAMIKGGLFDQLGGGFHRYSVDEAWRIPHFEKMLYDNALLSIALLEAYQVYQVEDFLHCARETLQFVQREMSHPEGGFYSAQDADSLNPETNEKQEGYYWTFSFEELERKLTPEELTAVRQTFHIDRNGNLDGRNVLYRSMSPNQVAQHDPLLTSAMRKMTQLREERPKPRTDDKIISAWNAWMIWAFTKGFQVTKNVSYLSSAQKAMQFLKKHLFLEGQLQRSYRDGRHSTTAFSEDYAALILACLSLYECDFDESHLSLAIDLQKTMDEKFWDSQNSGYFVSDASDPHLVLRLKDDSDGVHPSSNSMATLNLLKLWHLTGRSGYKDKADRIFEVFSSRLQRAPTSLAFLMIGLDFATHPVDKIVFKEMNMETKELFTELNKTLRPWTVVGRSSDLCPWPAPSGSAGKFAVCSDETCHPAVDTCRDVMDLLLKPQT